MKIPKELTTITLLSKTLAFILFTTMPIIGFFYGMQYQQMIDLQNLQQSESQITTPKRVPTPTPKQVDMTNWKTYMDPLKRFSIQYPDNATISDSGNDGVTIGYLGGIQTEEEFKKAYWLEIKIFKNTSKISLMELEKNPLLEITHTSYSLESHSIYKNSLKPYNNEEIKGIIYSINYDNGDQSATREEISMIKDTYIYTFAYGNQADLVQNDGQQTIHKILSTIKFTQ